MNPLNIGIIGSGRAGLIHARNFKKGIKNARLHSLVDPVTENLHHASQELDLDHAFDNYQDALDDPELDAIIITSPTVFHKEITVQAAKNKKHVFCEKPMAMNADECREMVEACKDNGVILQIGFMRRFDKNFTLAKERIMQGEIGDVVSVKSVTHGPSIPKPWMMDIKKSNGPLAEVNSHDIDTLRWFTESEFSHVYAVAGNYRCKDKKDEFPDFYDNVLMNCSFENGMQGLVDGAVSVNYGYDARAEILGTKGIIFIGSMNASNTIVCTQKTGVAQPIVESWRTLFLESYLQEDMEFVEAILEERPPRVTGKDGLEAVRVVNAGNRSIKENRIVHLSEIK